MKPFLNSFLFLCIMVVGCGLEVRAQWAHPTAPAIPGTDGYVVIPEAAIQPDKTKIYRAVFDATRGAAKPNEVVPAINMIGSEINALVAGGLTLKHAKFVIVFHGPAVNGILDDSHYRAKYGVANPNLEILNKLRKAGVEVFVCGQHLAAEKIDPKTLSSDVTLAADALIVLMLYQNEGYALMSF